MNASVPTPRQEPRFGLSKQNEQRANEPSMEEILASIRRIIADDQTLPRAFPPRPEPALHAVPVIEAPAPVSAEMVQPKSWPEAEPLDAPVVAEVPPKVMETVTVNEIADEAPASEALLSPDASQSVAQAFDALDRTIRMHSDGTLEDMSRDLLRPMLKSWLDENLPALVERLVKAEIERVVRGGK